MTRIVSIGYTDDLGTSRRYSGKVNAFIPFAEGSFYDFVLTKLDLQTARELLAALPGVVVKYYVITMDEAGVRHYRLAKPDQLATLPVTPNVLKRAVGYLENGDYYVYNRLTAEFELYTQTQATEQFIVDPMKLLTLLMESLKHPDRRPASYVILDHCTLGLVDSNIVQ
jgi:hypothetical protein